MPDYKIRGVIIVENDIVYIQGHRKWNLGNLLDEGDAVYIEIEKPVTIETNMEKDDMLKIIEELKSE